MDYRVRPTAQLPTTDGIGMDGQSEVKAQLIDVLKSAPGLKLWLADGELRYRAPKGLMTESLLGLIKSNKSLIVDVLKRQSGFGAGQPERPTYRAVDTPTSFRMRFHDRIWRNRDLFGVDYTNGPMVMRRVPGSPNLNAIRQLINALQKRHDVLRGRFQQADGLPVLSMKPKYKVPVYVRGIELDSSDNWEGWEINQTSTRRRGVSSHGHGAKPGSRLIRWKNPGASWWRRWTTTTIFSALSSITLFAISMPCRRWPTRLRSYTTR